MILCCNSFVKPFFQSHFARKNGCQGRLHILCSNIYPDIRVSTRGQAREGNSLEVQIKELKAAGAEKLFTDIFSETKMDRPEFDKLSATIKNGDTLIVTKLDRLGRSVSQASALITKMIDDGIIKERILYCKT